MPLFSPLPLNSSKTAKKKEATRIKRTRNRIWNRGVAKKDHASLSDCLEVLQPRSLPGHGLDFLLLLAQSRIAMRVHLPLPRKRDILSLDLLVLLLLLLLLVLVALVLLLLLLGLVHLGLINIHDVGFPLLILFAALLG